MQMGQQRKATVGSSKHGYSHISEYRTYKILPIIHNPYRTD
jgi:hypothetical protein